LKQKVVYQNKTYTCTKSGNKLVWSKGIPVLKPSPIPTPIPTPTSTAAPTPLPNPTNAQRVSSEGMAVSTQINSIESCKIKTKYVDDVESKPWFKEVKLGFQKAPNRLKSFGVIKAVMIYVSFNDVNPSGEPIAESKAMTMEFAKFLKENSYGKVSVDFTIPNKYFKISKDSSTYKMNTWNSGMPRSYLDDAIAAANDEVDFSQFDLIFVIPPESITEIVYGPAFAESGNYAIVTDGARITSAAVAGADSRNPKVMLSPWVWMAHETGHLFGFIHPYSNVTGLAPYWDLMFWDVGGPGYFGWNRFVVGWIEDDRVFCGSRNSKFTSLIAPLSSSNSEKNLIVIPDANNSAIVIENRRATTFDKLKIDEEGIVVYQVFLTQPNEEVKLAQTENRIAGRETGILKPGESIVINGITIKNSGSYTEGDLVEVSS
jgi:M6 family metalloprotease-like protein